MSEPRVTTCYRCGRKGPPSLVDPWVKRCRRSCLGRLKFGSGQTVNRHLAGLKAAETRRLGKGRK